MYIYTYIVVSAVKHGKNVARDVISNQNIRQEIRHSSEKILRRYYVSTRTFKHFGILGFQSHIRKHSLTVIIVKNKPELPSLLLSVAPKSTLWTLSTC